MKSAKSNCTIYFICAIVFYIVALLNLLSGGAQTMEIVWFCVGTAFLSLGTVQKKKEGKADDTENTGDDTVDEQKEQH